MQTPGLHPRESDSVGLQCETCTFKKQIQVLPSFHEYELHIYLGSGSVLYLRTEQTRLLSVWHLLPKRDRIVRQCNLGSCIFPLQFFISFLTSP